METLSATSPNHCLPTGFNSAMPVYKLSEVQVLSWTLAYITILIMFYFSITFQRQVQDKKPNIGRGKRARIIRVEVQVISYLKRYPADTKKKLQACFCRREFSIFTDWQAFIFFGMENIKTLKLSYISYHCGFPPQTSLPQKKRKKKIKIESQFICSDQF